MDQGEAQGSSFAHICGNSDTHPRTLHSDSRWFGQHHDAENDPGTRDVDIEGKQDAHSHNVSRNN